MAIRVIMLAAESAGEAEETLHELPMPAYMFGVIALLLFALALAVTWAFRGTAAKMGERNAPDSAHSTGSTHTSGSGHH